MKVLIFDLEIYENDIFDIIGNYFEYINLYKTNDKEEFLIALKSNQYDLLIIDVDTKLGDLVFNETTNLNNKYKIIVTSNKLTYNSELSCNTCSLRYNRKLLLKPLKANELIYYIENYDKLSCKFSTVSNNILNILEDIIEQFKSYTYIKEESRIFSLSENTKELISIIELLELHNIKYQIDNDDIKL